MPRKKFWKMARRKMPQKNEEKIKEPIDKTIKATYKEPTEDPFNKSFFDSTKEPIKETIKEPNNEIIEELTEETEDKFDESFCDSTKDPFNESLCDLTKDPFHESFSDSTKDPFHESFSDSTKDPFSESFCDITEDPLNESFRDSSKDKFNESIGDSPEVPLPEPINEPFNKPMLQPVKEQFLKKLMQQNEEPIQEFIKESINEPIAKHKVPIEEITEEPMIDAINDFSNESATQAIKEPQTTSVSVSIKCPMNQSFIDSMKVPFNKSVSLPKLFNEPFNKAIEETNKEPIKHLFPNPINSPLYSSRSMYKHRNEPIKDLSQNPDKEYMNYERNATNKQFVQGNFHQGNDKYMGATPCVANSLMSMVYSKTNPIYSWQSTDLNDILDMGYHLYCDIQRSLNWKHPFLLISEIPSEFEIHDQRYRLSITDSYVGLVLNESEEEMGVIMSLNQALNKSLYQSNFCFVTFNNQTFSVIKSNGVYYRFDPHSRDQNGNQCPDGASVLIQSNTLSELHRQCLDLARSMRVSVEEQFEVSIANIAAVKKQASADPISPVNASNISEECDSDLKIVAVENLSHSRYFDPLPISTRTKLCNDLHINDCLSHLHNTPESVLLTSPCQTKSIRGEGNCFFRALSFAVSGTENNHIRIRHLIVNYLIDRHGLFDKHLRQEFVSIDDYLKKTSMYYSGTWATELEVHAAAHMLNSDIYTFSNNTWLRFSPSDIDAGATIQQGSLYLHHSQSHYDVVLCVKSPDNDICNACKNSPHPSEIATNATHWSTQRRTGVKRNLEIQCKMTRKETKRRKYIDSTVREKGLKYEVFKMEKDKNDAGYNKEKIIREKYRRRNQERYWNNEKFRESVKLRMSNKYKTDEAYRRNNIARGKAKYQTDSAHKNKVIARDKAKYNNNSAHRNKVIARVKSKYTNNSEHRNKVITRGKTKYKNDTSHRQNVISRSKKKYKNNPVHRANVIACSKRKYHSDPMCKDRTIKLCSTAKYKADPTFRYQIKQGNRRRREETRKRLFCMENSIKDFKQKCLQGPDYVCCVCHRLLFDNQVTKCCIQSFKNRGPMVEKVAMSAISYKYFHDCSACQAKCLLKSTSRSSLWICYTCQRKLLKGKMPAEASVNNLLPEQTSEELICLNSIERHLISLQIPFVKMVALPKGGQRAVQGPVICVPSDITKAASVLPRFDTDDQLLRIKLKRKLSYKGHYDYQFVQKSRLKTAFDFLKQNNKWYKDVTFQENWENPFPEMPETEKETAATNNADKESDDKIETFSQQDTDDELPDLNINVTEENNDQESGPLLDTSLQPVDLAQEILDHYSEEVLCVAPAEGNSPIQILQDESNEAKSFPVLFPSGNGTFHDTREEKLSLSRYLHTRLMNVDNRFAKDITYIFHSQYRSEIQQVLSSISIAMRKGSSNINGKTINAQMLTNKNSLNGILKSDEGYKFLKPIRGTPQFWQSAQKDVFAMLRQLGIPTWFASFSSADMRWPEIVETILKQQGDVRKASELDWREKCDVLRSNPVTVARMFEHRFQIFLTQVILSKAAPIGKIVDYFYRIEFQQRGSPHVHALFWVENSPKLNKDSDEAVVNFINKYITCALPTTDDNPELSRIVTQVQRHSPRHSKTCKKKGTECRFGYPRAPSSNHTFIARPEEKSDTSSKVNVLNETPQENNFDIPMSIDHAKKLLSEIRKALTSDKQYNSTNALLEDHSITEEEYIKAFHMISKKSNIILQRQPSDIWINHYNPILLEAWDGNMDIQYVLDAYSCVVYIVSYLSKAEREMSLLLEHTQKEMSKNENRDVKAAMRKLGTVYLHNREVSAQEAVFRVCNLKLKQCSRKVQFIPVGQDPIKMSLPLRVLQNKCKEENLGSDVIWMTNLIDRYKNRPDNWEFEYMCLARFCSEYRILYGSEAANQTESEIKYRLKNNLGFIQKRTRGKPAVIRYPRYSPTRTPEKYYHSILQIFLPHRTDQQLLPTPFDRYEDFYLTGAVRCFVVEPVQQIVDRNRTEFEIEADDIDKAATDLEKFGPLEDAWSLICPETEQNRIECKLARQNETGDENIHEDENNMPDLITVSSEKNRKEVRQCPISRNEAIPLMRSLNSQQSTIFYKIRQWCLDKMNGHNPDPLRLFITGGAGTGKSHLIKCIYYESTRLLAPSMPNPDDNSVIITAPTGVAAFNIGASTIHSTFAIRTDVKLPYQPLAEDTLNTLRTKLSNLEILIIDEISMVDHKLLTYIHGRLRQIKQTRDYSPFGKVSIIAVGDFYQLPPVKGSALYVEQAGIDLWNGTFSKFELSEIMRQKDDAHFANCLNRIRTKDKKQRLSNDDLCFMKQAQSKEGPTDCLHLFGTNVEVDNHNLTVLKSSCKNPIVIESEDFMRDGRTGRLTKRNTHHSKVYNTNLPKSITLGLGARVMLTKNIDISDGLVNGVFGTVSGIVNSADSSFPSKVYIRFDKEKVGQKLRKSHLVHGNETPIEPQEDRVNNKGGVRRQFPLKLAWACTVHKVQGLTVSKAVVSMKRVFSPGQSYVALSRVTSAEGLVIRDFNQDQLYCNKLVETALAGMQNLLQPSPTTVPTNIRLVLHNIQGIQANFENIRSDPRFTDADLICVTETWLSQNENITPVNVTGFTFYHNPRSISYISDNPYCASLKSQAHGGVALYIKSKSRFQALNIKVNNMEMVACSIHELDLTIATIYRPQAYPINLFLKALETLIHQLAHLSENSIVMGDFNQDINKKELTITKHMSRNGYRQIVNFPTTEMGTLIDHVYVRGGLSISASVLPTFFSYHEAIELLL